MGDDLAELKAATARVSAFIASRAVPAAPRRTGKLAGTIRGNKSLSRATVMAGGAATPYAGPIHWGWPSRGIEAQPFIAETAQDTEPQWLDFYMSDIEKAVDNVAGKTY